MRVSVYKEENMRIFRYTAMIIIIPLLLLSCAKQDVEEKVLGVR